MQPAKRGPVKRRVENAERIHIENADSFTFNKAINPDVQILRGHVIFRHGNTYMYCDSANYYEKTNSLDAFGHIKILKGANIKIYGSSLKYDGQTSLAELRENVNMMDRDVSIHTDSFNYDRLANVAYFFKGGTLVNKDNVLTSDYGEYKPDRRLAYFESNVTLKNPKFTLIADSLYYNTFTKVATLVGRTIVESDSGTVYCWYNGANSYNGWYNTNTNKCMLFNRSYIISKDKSRTLTADSIFFDRANGIGRAYGNFDARDTLKKIILTGNFGYVNNKLNYSYATDSAQCIEYSQGDSSYIHADTLFAKTVGNYRDLKAFYKVRFFRKDIQGVCDSLFFSNRDSLLRLTKEPILWNNGYQITGDTIHVHFNDSTVDKVHVINYAFTIEKVDTTYYNQMKGRDLLALFKGKELNRIIIKGDAQTIYYPMDRQKFIGMNHTESAYLDAKIVNRKPARTVIWPSPKGVLKPLPDLNQETKFLKDFVDFNYIRPKDRYDIFNQTIKKPEDAATQQRHKIVKKEYYD